MYEAEVGDDVYGEDPTVNRLQEMAARITGMEAALFVSSGSMGNLIPIFLNCGRGNEFLIDWRGHAINFELSAASAIAGSLPVPITTEDGILEAGMLEERFRPDIYYMARTRLVLLENTHNLAGGTFYTLEGLKRIRELTRAKGLSVHMDGARMFNASAASGAGPHDIAAQTDTLTFCLSKGLGAPVGAMLCGSRAFIAEARRVRKLLGGGMRQVGVLAAAGIYALENNVDRLSEDHENAKHPAEKISQALKQHGVLCGATGKNDLRFVTHLDLSKSDIADAAEIIRKLAP
jgi:threonine aldolase